MMCSESEPKGLENTTEVLPITEHGLSSTEKNIKVEEEEDHLEWLKKAGLTSEEIKLYEENQGTFLELFQKSYQNAKPGIIKDKLEVIFNKISNIPNKKKSNSTIQDVQPSTSSAATPANLIERLQQTPVTSYPEGHPMNELKELEQHILGVGKADMIHPTKGPKLYQRLQKKKDRLLEDKPFHITSKPSTPRVDGPQSFWETREVPRLIPHTITSQDQEENAMFPHFERLYTVRNNQILMLVNPVEADQGEYRDYVMPFNEAEPQLWEGTKMCLDDIRKIDQFKNYSPGIPSKFLFLKNIDPRVSQPQLLMLFNQFVLANGGPVHVQMMTGRTSGKAFVNFRSVKLAIQALEEINGTILFGRPVIAMFGRNTNVILDDYGR